MSELFLSSDLKIETIDSNFDVAIEGCAHGELEIIYDLITFVNTEKSRNVKDLDSMAVPPKFRRLNSFYQYYEGIKKAPCLTIFIGGNHEASEYLWELPYGGWVAPMIFYMGWANVVNFVYEYSPFEKGNWHQIIIRIAGISGIYKKQDYNIGHFERPPLNEDTKRSIYHIRNLDVYRLSLLDTSINPINICLSHDWPSGIWNYGDVDRLLTIKPYFQKDIQSGQLGSPPTNELLKKLKPDYWFSAHLHVKFAALFPHKSYSKNNKESSLDDEDDTTIKETFTKFLALDKCLPHRQFLQVISFPHSVKDIEISAKSDSPDNDNDLATSSLDNGKFKTRSYLAYDLEWIDVLRKTDSLVNCDKTRTNIPYALEEPLLSQQPDDLKKVRSTITPIAFPSSNLFVPTTKNSPATINIQTLEFCQKFNLINLYDELKPPENETLENVDKYFDF
ncbi:unnamed protein product [Gordionus sp. m RMFG-2023]